MLSMLMTTEYVPAGGAGTSCSNRFSALPVVTDAFGGAVSTHTLGGVRLSAVLTLKTRRMRRIYPGRLCAGGLRGAKYRPHRLAHGMAADQKAASQPDAPAAWERHAAPQRGGMGRHSRAGVGLDADERTLLQGGIGKPGDEERRVMLLKLRA